MILTDPKEAVTDPYKGDEHLLTGDPAYRRGDMYPPRPVKDSPQA